MSNAAEQVTALPEGAWVLTEAVFLVPTHPFPESDHERFVHGQVQQIVTLVYAMLACGMDISTINERILGIAL